MSDTFDHYNDAMESLYNEMDEGNVSDEYYQKHYYESSPVIFLDNRSKSNPKQVKETITVTHFGKNLISEMTQAHLENSIKFVISKNSVLDDYQKQLIKVMTNRVNELKTKQPTTSFTIIDNKTGEVIFEC
jgi:hypothetical protein